MSDAAYARLTAMLAEGEGLDDAQPMYSPLGELRQFKAEYDRLRDALQRIIDLPIDEEKSAGFHFAEVRRIARETMGRG